MEYLDYLTDVEWNQLPTDYKNSKIEHTNTVRSIKRLEKQLINIDLTVKKRLTALGVYWKIIFSSILDKSSKTNFLSD